MTSIDERLTALEAEMAALKARFSALQQSNHQTGADLARETAERFKGISPDEWKEINEAMRQAREELNRLPESE